MRKLPLLAAIIASCLVASGTGPLAQTFPPDLPIALVCWNGKVKQWVVGYLQTVMQDGTAIYRHTHISAMVTTKRVVEPRDRAPPVADCFGKTLDELRAIGRVVDFPRAK
jgi:hypothetical protein